MDFVCSCGAHFATTSALAKHKVGNVHKERLERKERFRIAGSDALKRMKVEKEDQPINKVSSFVKCMDSLKIDKS